LFLQTLQNHSKADTETQENSKRTGNAPTIPPPF